MKRYPPHTAPKGAARKPRADKAGGWRVSGERIGHLAARVLASWLVESFGPLVAAPRKGSSVAAPLPGLPLAVWRAAPNDAARRRLIRGLIGAFTGPDGSVVRSGHSKRSDNRIARDLDLCAARVGALATERAGRADRARESEIGGVAVRGANLGAIDLAAPSPTVAARQSRRARAAARRADGRRSLYATERAARHARLVAVAALQRAIATPVDAGPVAGPVVPYGPVKRNVQPYQHGKRYKGPVGPVCPSYPVGLEAGPVDAGRCYAPPARPVAGYNPVSLPERELADDLQIDRELVRRGDLSTGRVNMLATLGFAYLGAARGPRGPFGEPTIDADLAIAIVRAALPSGPPTTTKHGPVVAVGAGPVDPIIDRAARATRAQSSGLRALLRSLAGPGLERANLIARHSIIAARSERIAREARSVARATDTLSRSRLWRERARFEASAQALA